MGNTSVNKQNSETEKSSEHINIGLVAHVDAGKTTLAESILYLTGSIRKLGRVDHKDAFLDTYELEKARGITVFSKQAEFDLGTMKTALLDTPGHVDFSAEMERTLQVLDYAVLIISGTDGVQGHVETLWRLLERYQIPVFIFVNKMDLDGMGREALLDQLKKRLDERCMAFDEERDEEKWAEELAVSREMILEQYLETGEIRTEDIQSLIRDREVFPCYFGSALKLQGVEALLKGLERYAACPDYPDEFGARVYKISRDSQNNRLTHLKVTGGTLKVKMPVRTGNDPGDGTAGQEEKADQIRIYSGASYRTVQEAPAGTVCAVTGLDGTYCGQGLGAEHGSELPLLLPVMNYRIQLPDESDVYRTFLQLRALEEEEPLLHLVWEERLGEIHAQVMGAVQIEILKSLIKERFGISVEFDAGSIVYKETIRNTVEGVGHFEPLRHYAEVHLLMEPGEPGSGLQFSSVCSEDMLDKNWQRLVLTHLEEKHHRGVLIGAEITDMKITLTAGRAHQKHTEGGDFRQATYRAVRQGLRTAQSVLLEPVYEYQLEVPSFAAGRALADLQRMQASFPAPETDGDMCLIKGTAPVACMQGYQSEVLSYTKGRGRLSCLLSGYAPCHNAEEVIEAAGYDADADLDNPSGSVFCAHGAGFVVPWDQVPQYMHVESCLKNRTEEPDPAPDRMEDRDVFAGTEHGNGAETGGRRESYASFQASEKELEEIFVRTYGAVERRRSGFGKTVHPGSADIRKTARRQGQSAGPGKKTAKEPEKEYLLVDGYNIIFAWEELAELAAVDIAAARGKLMDILSNYQGYKKYTVILVFDAYKVEGGTGEIFRYHNIHVVFTKEAETADQYIEKTVHEIGKQYQVTVATSDALEQVIIMGQGARRMSAAGLRTEIEAASVEIREICREHPGGGKHYLFDQLPEEMADYMEEVRLGKQKLSPENGKPGET